MGIQVTSTSTESEAKPQEVAAKANEPVEKSASPQNEADETQDESETSEALEASENDDAQEKEDSENGEVKPKPKSNGFKKRIDKLNSRLSAKDQELEYWKKEALKAKEIQEPQVKDDVKKETVTDGEPNPDDFETHVAYVKAFTKWELDQRDKDREVKQKEAEAKTAVKTQVETFQSKVQEFKKDKEDFDDVIEAADDIIMSLGVQESILSSDFGPELMYELAKNRDEYERINKLTPLAAAREIGKIEAKLSKSESSEEKKPEAKKLTKAPPPMAPVGSKGAGSSKKSIFDPDLPQAEYERLRREQMKANSAY